MPSFTEELLGETFKQIDTGFKELALKLDVTKLEGPVSAINNVFFRIENSLKTLVFRTALIEASGQVRQERKQAMLRELYDSKVGADLVKARDLRAELDRLFQDLESFKAKALRDEQMGKMGLSSFELLTLSARVLLSIVKNEDFGTTLTFTNAIPANLDRSSRFWYPAIKS